MKRPRVNSRRTRKINLPILEANPRKKLIKEMARKKTIKIASTQVNCKKASMDGNSTNVRKFITQ